MTGRPFVTHDELSATVARADLVVSHAGTGAALTALEHGRTPLLVPRRAGHGEHVDNHQRQIATDLAHRGLAVSREVEQLDSAAILGAASGAVVRAAAPPPFFLAR